MTDSVPNDQQKIEDAVKNALEQMNASAPTSTPSSMPVVKPPPPTPTSSTVVNNAELTHSDATKPIDQTKAEASAFVKPSMPPKQPPPTPMVQPDKKPQATVPPIQTQSVPLVQGNTVSVPPSASSQLIDSLISKNIPLASPMPAGTKTTPLPMDTKSTVVPPPQKKKRNAGVFAAIIGVVVLLLSLPVAVYFISQRNSQLTDQRNRAYEIGGPYPEGAVCSINNDCASGYCTGNRCRPRPAGMEPAVGCENGKWTLVSGVWYCSYNGKIDCTTGTIQGGGDGCTLNGTPVSCTQVNMIKCNCVGDIWVQVYQPPGTQLKCWDVCQTANIPCGDTCNPPTTNPPQSSVTPGSTSTPTPIGGQCTNIKLLKNNVEVVDKSTLRAGDQITIAVAGTNATQARVRINGGQWNITTNKNSSNQYVVPFTIPQDVVHFVIESEVYVNGAWK